MERNDTGVPYVRTWAAFEKKIRLQGYPLLRNLGCFEDPILVAGCQRSGTTIVASIISNSEGVMNPWIAGDSELQAANALAGGLTLSNTGRCCFQTTYLNQQYREYYQHKHFRLLWLVRKPESVVFSMLKNWKRGALNRLFNGCGSGTLSDEQRMRYERFGPYVFGKLEKACRSYVAKTNQLHEIVQNMANERFCVVEYDQLMRNSPDLLPKIYEFLNLPFDKSQADKLHDRSTEKAARLGDRRRDVIVGLCGEAYSRACTYLTWNMDSS